MGHRTGKVRQGMSVWTGHWSRLWPSLCRSWINFHFSWAQRFPCRAFPTGLQRNIVTAFSHYFFHRFADGVFITSFHHSSEVKLVRHVSFNSISIHHYCQLNTKLRNNCNSQTFRNYSSKDTHGSDARWSKSLIEMITLSSPDEGLVVFGWCCSQQCSGIQAGNLPKS